MSRVSNLCFVQLTFEGIESIVPSFFCSADHRSEVRFAWNVEITARVKDLQSICQPQDESFYSKIQTLTDLCHRKDSINSHRLHTLSDIHREECKDYQCCCSGERILNRHNNSQGHTAWCKSSACRCMFPRKLSHIRCNVHGYHSTVLGRHIGHLLFGRSPSCRSNLVCRFVRTALAA